MTGVGVLLGTAAYMSPEQARGRVADKRSDVWAFGCVLYEMLTGQRAFGGEDITDTLAAVVRAEPAWDALPADVSPSVRVFLRRCLQKAAKQRLHDIADMRLALESAFDVSIDTVAPAPAAARQRRGLTVVLYGVGVAFAAVLGGSAVWLTQSQEPPHVARLVATPSSGIVIAPTQADPDVAISSDGTRIAYVNVDQGGLALFVRALDSLDVVKMEGVGQPRSPFFSPDGQTIGFFDGQSLKRVSATGGPAVTITKTVGNPRGASWGADDSIIYATSEARGLMRVGAGGGDPAELTKPNAGEDHILPQVLPGGRAVLFTVSTGGRPISNAEIAILDLGAGTVRTIVRGGSHAQYAATGHLVLGFAGTLRSVGFDLETLTTRGNPVPVIDRVVTKFNGPANFALSPTGVLVYTAGDAAGVERTLVWVDRQGREEPLPTPKRSYAYPRISPDGTRVALDIRDQENDVWIWHLVRQTLSRLTFDPRLNRGVEWTPDGRRVVFSVAGEDGTESLFWQNSDGSGNAERLTTASAGRSQVPHSFLPDGLSLIFSEPGQQPFDMFLLPVSGDGKPLPLLNASYSEHNGQVSPDGRWLAYQSDESGRPEIYVRRFPRLDSRSQVSTDGGTRPTWSRNGRELFYMAAPGPSGVGGGEGTMVAVAVQDEGQGFQAGASTTLFQGPYFNVLAGRTYDVSPDGQRFLMIKNAVSGTAGSAPQVVVVLNWHEELKRLVPAN